MSLWPIDLGLGQSGTEASLALGLINGSAPITLVPRVIRYDTTRVTIAIARRVTTAQTGSE
jgi:hypothetical protein